VGFFIGVGLWTRRGCLLSTMVGEATLSPGRPEAAATVRVDSPYLRLVDNTPSGMGDDGVITGSG
jgi:hypothetical protein